MRLQNPPPFPRMDRMCFNGAGAVLRHVHNLSFVCVSGASTGGGLLRPSSSCPALANVCEFAQSRRVHTPLGV